MNTVGGYKCTCTQPDTQLDVDKRTCVPSDTDTCKQCSHSCDTEFGVAVCTCPTGYRLADDHKTCIAMTANSTVNTNADSTVNSKANSTVSTDATSTLNSTQKDPCDALDCEHRCHRAGVDNSYCYCIDGYRMNLTTQKCQG